MRFAQTPSAARVHEVSVQLGGVNSNTLDKADWEWLTLNPIIILSNVHLCRVAYYWTGLASVETSILTMQLCEFKRYSNHIVATDSRQQMHVSDVHFSGVHCSVWLSLFLSHVIVYLTFYCFTFLLSIRLLFLVNQSTQIRWVHWRNTPLLTSPLPVSQPKHSANGLQVILVC